MTAADEPLTAQGRSGPPAQREPSTILPGQAHMELRRPVIGLAALSGSGKSHAAVVLMNRCFDPGFVTLSFAAPIRDMLCAMGLPAAALAGDARQAPHPLLQGRSPRYAMRSLGTEWGRNLIGGDLWTGIWRQRAVRILEHGSGVVADDVRFADEAGVIRELGGIVVRIIRPGIDRDTAHVSEAQDFAADLTIVNDGSLEAFDERVVRLGRQVVRCRSDIR